MFLVLGPLLEDYSQALIKSLGASQSYSRCQSSCRKPVIKSRSVFIFSKDQLLVDPHLDF